MSETTPDASQPTESIWWGRYVLREAARALEASAERLGPAFSEAVEVMAQAPGVHVIALGKSGHIARKMAATLSSTGCPAGWLHASEALHGDVGRVRRGDAAVLISKSGTTTELIKLLPVLRQLNCALIAVTANLSSPLAQGCDVVLDASVAREADGLNLAPTTSTTLTLALGDALAVALLQRKDFTANDFAKTHPAGQLGANLSLTVADVMHPHAKLATAPPEAPLQELLIQMTEVNLGATLVELRPQELLGIITDGDIRRALIRADHLLTQTAGDLMTANPITIRASASLHEALNVMENRASQIAVLPVVEAGQCVGLLRLHDIYRPTVV